MSSFEIIEAVGKAIDVIGVAVIAAGGALAAGVTIGRLIRRTPNTYRLFRSELGRAILVGLELLVAADIIRTVAITPTLESIAVLGAIVLIRTFLSWSLELEISGRWPWQKRPPTTPEPGAVMPVKATHPE